MTAPSSIVSYLASSFKAAIRKEPAEAVPATRSGANLPPTASPTRLPMSAASSLWHGRSCPTRRVPNFSSSLRTLHLDGQYAAFGRVISGMEEVDRIASVPWDAADRPLEPQRIAKATVDLGGVEYPEPEKIS